MKQKTGCRSLSFDPQEVDWESCTSPANLGKLLSKPFATNKTMNSEPINFAELLTQRKASAEKTLHEISEVELRALIAKLFPDATHPWKESFTSFIDEHLSETARASPVLATESHAGSCRLTLNSLLLLAILQDAGGEVYAIATWNLEWFPAGKPNSSQAERLIHMSAALRRLN